jgi:hypothetical protein
MVPTGGPQHHVSHTGSLPPRIERRLITRRLHNRAIDKLLKPPIGTRGSQVAQYVRRGCQYAVRLDTMKFDHIVADDSFADVVRQAAGDGRIWI